MGYRFLRCERKEAVAIVTLNRPEKRNALSIALREEIVKCLEELEGDETVKTVVLTGAGPSFCAGFDLSELSAGDMERIFSEARAYHRSVYTFPKPLIAAVNGPALAGGMDLAIMCDMRIASEVASFGQPQVRMGIVAAYDLIRTVLPEAVARDLCLTGRRMEPQEALRLGFVSAVVSPDRLMEEAVGVAQVVAENRTGLSTKRQFLEEQPPLFG